MESSLVVRPLVVGLTYDLAAEHLARGATEEEAAEFDREDTIDAIAEIIEAQGHRAERIGGVLALSQRLVAGQRWDLVFNIAEGSFGAARESQVPSLLDAYRIPYTFSDPLVLALALHKGHAKAVVRAAGVATPDYLVVSDATQLMRCELAYPLFIKPVAEGTSKGITSESIVPDREHLLRVGRELLERYAQPVLVERFLPGREFTVGILGTGGQAKVLGSLEVRLVGDADVGVYSYRNKKQFEGKVEYRLVRPREDATIALSERVALAAYRVLGCRDAGRVDIRLDEAGRPCFIEANPLAGLNPTISDLAILVRQTGLGYRALIAGILDSANQRLALP